MNFVESVALSSGLKISKPQIESLFFPTVPQKYITFCSENHQSKQWDHLQEWIKLIKPYLDKENISIIELGANELSFEGVISLKGVSPNHHSYIMERSLLHMGPENFLSHLASFHGIPYIALFSNTNPAYARPLWDSSHSQALLLDPPRHGGAKPSFLGEEMPKSINRIDAETVAAHTLNRLEIQNDFSDFDILYTGSNYHLTLIEVIPDFSPPPEFLPRSLINLRLDYLFNIDPLLTFANNRKLSLIFDKPVDINLLRRIRPSIEAMFVKINESFELEYIKQLSSLAVPLSLLGQPDADLGSLRLKFFDWHVEEEIKKTKKDLDKSIEICDTTRYKSSRILFSQGERYSSKAAYDKKIKSHEDQLIIDNPIFWEECDNFKLYNIKSDGKKENR